SFAKLGLGKTQLISHSIVVGDAKAVKQSHYTVSPAVEKLLYGEVDRMLKLGVIEEAESAWSSPVVLVQKPGTVRLCLDCRKVNSFKQGDAYPQIDAILSRLPKALSKAQKNYSVTEPECLAAIICINRFRPYVDGHRFTVVTDHASLQWLMSQPDLRSRLGRWAAKLKGYRFKFEHRKGKLHAVPDALSMIFEGEDEGMEVSGIDVDYESPHFESSEYNTLAETVEANKDMTPDLRVMDGKVFRRT
ncbi:hypothetical protein KR074_007481, partial [Drosophila pseudoananassae]